jgi:hypothetical protein
MLHNSQNATVYNEEYADNNGACKRIFPLKEAAKKCP